MTTWGQFRDSIRIALNDTKTQPKWSNDELLQYMRNALADYSRYFPLMKRWVLSADPSGSGYTLPDDLLEVSAVEHPEGRFLEQVSMKAGTRYKTVSHSSQTYLSVPKPSFAYGWYIQDSRLFITEELYTGDAVILHYEALHTFPVNDDDKLTIPIADEELVSLYVQALCQRRVSVQSANLDRWKTKQDGGYYARTDNPLVPEYQVLMQAYHDGVAQRMPTGSVRTYLVGGRR